MKECRIYFQKSGGGYFYCYLLALISQVFNQVWLNCFQNHLWTQNIFIGGFPHCRGLCLIRQACPTQLQLLNSKSATIHTHTHTSNFVKTFIGFSGSGPQDSPPQETEPLQNLRTQFLTLCNSPTDQALAWTKQWSTCSAGPCVTWRPLETLWGSSLCCSGGRWSSYQLPSSGSW